MSEEERFIEQLRVGDRYHVMLKSEADRLGLEYFGLPEASDAVIVKLTEKNVRLLMDAGYEPIDYYAMREMREDERPSDTELERAKLEAEAEALRFLRDSHEYIEKWAEEGKSLGQD
jgi:hypothetical protein